MPVSPQAGPVSGNRSESPCFRFLAYIKLAQMDGSTAIKNETSCASCFIRIYSSAGSKTSKNSSSRIRLSPFTVPSM